MISVDEARNILRENLMEFGTSQVDMRDSYGSIISEDIHADRDFPPYERVTMDGIAISTKAIAEGKYDFEITHLQPAGSSKSTLADENEAIEVMTGAILPVNADAVIRYEDLHIEQKGDKKFAKVLIRNINPYQNVHRKGEDRKQGDVLIHKGTLISSAEIAVLATVGKNNVKVYDLPKTAIVSTGDELVDVDQVPNEHQIRKSNVYAIRNELAKLGAEVSLFHLADDKEELERELKKILSEFPVVILSGGVSKGKLDFVPEILEDAGIVKHFHRVSQRPGKPLWFGSSDRNVVFALPGNPVSTYMCCVVYVREWFLNCLGLRSETDFALLDADASFKPDLTYFMQVKLRYNKNGKFLATPVHGHGSGDLANLMDVSGFLELSRGQTLFRRGQAFPVHIFRTTRTSKF